MLKHEARNITTWVNRGYDACAIENTFLYNFPF